MDCRVLRRMGSFHRLEDSLRGLDFAMISGVTGTAAWQTFKRPL